MPNVCPVVEKDDRSLIDLADVKDTPRLLGMPTSLTCVAVHVMLPDPVLLPSMMNFNIKSHMTMPSRYI